MKYKNRIKSLETRIANWQRICQSDSKNSAAYQKPGSLKK